MEPIIKVENLGKSYIIGHQREKYVALRDVLANKARQVASKTKNLFSGGQLIAGNELEEFWALRDINFEVQQGDRVGIIGRNGAGKSTLLKVLSRITEPTTGSIRLRGRVASLLEVGTGFHPELSGRENIYLNGAILGMSRAEVKKKFDEIVDFAGVEKFLDTPVKRYSSGMYVRLAFAVAAHLEPEILIVDEVLAVGDAEFQKKCLGKMEDVSKNDGRTVLFVSHNLAAINQLCTNCILLSNGKLDKFGKTNHIVNQYLSIQSNHESIINLQNVNCIRSGNKKVQFQEIWLRKEKSTAYDRLFSIGENILIGFAIKFNNPNEKMIKTSIELKTSEGLKIANMIDVDSNFQVQFLTNNIASYVVRLDDIRLYPGIYLLSFYAGDMSSVETYDYVEDCISFEIIDGGRLTTRNLPQSAGILFLTPKWSNLS
jgi:lipopolysaccharide transport system ATP-binding protein